MEAKKITFALVTLVTILVNQAPGTTAQCRYMYTQQPPIELQCNPYLSGALRLSCEIAYSTTEQPIPIHWVFVPDTSPETPNRISASSGRYTVTPSSFTGRTTSGLQVTGLNDADAGKYSCQGVFRNGSRTGESQSSRIHVSAIYRSLGHSTCSTSSESVLVQTCALSGQVDSFTTTARPISVSNGGGGGGGGLGSNFGIYIAVAAVVIFVVITVFIVVICIVMFQACKYFD